MLVVATPTMPATVEILFPIVVIDADHPNTQAAPDPSRQHITPTTTAGKVPPVIPSPSDGQVNPLLLAREHQREWVDRQRDCSLNGEVAQYLSVPQVV
jgi:hypothetical protein